MTAAKYAVSALLLGGVVYLATPAIAIWMAFEKHWLSVEAAEAYARPAWSLALCFEPYRDFHEAELRWLGLGDA